MSITHFYSGCAGPNFDGYFYLPISTIIGLVGTPSEGHTRMGSVHARLLLFLSSYFPLAVILAVLFIPTYWVVSIFLVIVGVASVFGMFAYLKSLKDTAPFQVEVVGVQRRDSEVVSYVVGYVIPFLAVPFTGWQQGVGLALFFGVICVLHVKLNLIHINPTLAIADYRLYEVTTARGGVHSLITKRRVALGDRLRVVKIGEDILVERRS